MRLENWKLIRDKKYILLAKHKEPTLAFDEYLNDKLLILKNKIYADDYNIFKYTFLINGEYILFQDSNFLNSVYDEFQTVIRREAIDLLLMGYGKMTTYGPKNFSKGIDHIESVEREIKRKIDMYWKRAMNWNKEHNRKICIDYVTTLSTREYNNDDNYIIEHNSLKYKLIV